MLTRSPKGPSTRSLGPAKALQATILFAASLLLAVCVILVCDARGSEQNSIFQNLYHTGWTSRDGAPSNIEGFAQAPDGYLWIASQHGLYRFDGVSFERFQPTNGSVLLNDHLVSVTALPDGALWLSYAEYGASLIRGNSVTNYESGTELDGVHIFKFLQDADGTVWAATHRGLKRFDGHHWSNVAEEWNYLENYASDLYLDNEARLWVSSKRGVSYLSRGEHKFRDSNVHYDRFLTTLTRTQDGLYWISGIKGKVQPFRWRDEKLVPAGAPIDLKSLNLLTDRLGRLWILTTDAGLRCLTWPSSTMSLSPPFVSSFEKHDGLTGGEGSQILEDREGSLWVATSEGLDRFTPTKLSSETLPSGARALSIVNAGNGYIYATTGAAPPGIVRFGAGQRENVKGAPRSLTAACRDQAGTIWFGGPGMLWRYANGRFTSYAAPHHLNDRNPLIITSDRGGQVWIVFEDKDYLAWKNGEWIEHGNLKGLPDGVPVNILTDSVGRLWFSFSGDRVALVDGARVRSFTSSSGLNTGEVTSLAERNGRTWIGGLTGIQMFDGERFISLISDGEPFTDASGMVLRKNGDLWISQASGILRVPADELARFYADSSYRVKVEMFNSLDGIDGGPYPDYRLPSLIEADDGRLWSTTATGVNSVDPDHILRNTLRPTVVIRKVVADNRSYQPDSAITLPARSQNLTIDYTALSLAIPQRVRFRYKLEGFDKDWQEAGTRRQAFYTSLRPGRYSFHVIACNNDGVWNTAGVTLPIDLPATFLQSRYFKLLCATVAAVLLWCVYLLRINQAEGRIRTRLYERLAERERIARDLHDTFFQGIQGLLLRFDLGMKRLARGDPVRALFEEALTQSDKVMQQGRELVLDLRTRSSEAGDLAHDLEAAATEFAKQYPARFTLVVTGKERALNSLIAEELYKLGGEALFNSFSHASATSIEAEIIFGANELGLNVRDDGSGVSQDILQHGGVDKHYGLLGMKERAEQIGARFSIFSRAGAGTEIEVRVPSKVAYCSARRSVNGLLTKLMKHTDTKS